MGKKCYWMRALYLSEINSICSSDGDAADDDVEQSQLKRILIVCQSSFGEKGFELRQAIRATWASKTQTTDTAKNKPNASSDPKITPNDSKPSSDDKKEVSADAKPTSVDFEQTSDDFKPSLPDSKPSSADFKPSSGDSKPALSSQYPVSVIFLLGTSANKSQQNDLEIESQKFGDILQVSLFCD